MRKTTLLLAILLVSVSCFAQITLEDLKQTYTTALEEWQVPGVAVAIIKNDSVILSEGFGINHINNATEVDENTLFAIASNTKAFTATAIAMLVDDGKIDWDNRVIDYLPWFELYDPYVSAHMTIRDLLCHRSGLKTFSGDLLWYGSNYTRKEVVKRAKHLEPAYGFRAQFGYSNILYLTAGLVVEEVSGMSWDDFLKERFFKPLKMDRTITSTHALKNMDNIAAPHNTTDEGVIAIEYLNWDNIAPAGSIISCVSDLSNWLKVNLNHGVFNQDTLFTASVQDELWTPHTPLKVSTFARKLWPTTHMKAYGLGWSMYDYQGKKIITHNGGYDGMISQTVLIPEEKSGFVILTNSLSGLYSPLIYETLDFVLDVRTKDWMEYFTDREERYKEYLAKKKEKEDSSRQENTQPTLPLENYTGTYSSELYGDVTITIDHEALAIKMLPSPKFHSEMKHWHYDTFEIEFEEFPSLPRGWVSFILDRKGKVQEMRIDVPNPDFDFTEIKLFKTK